MIGQSQSEFTKAIRTKRFDVVNCNWIESYRVTEIWRNDDDVIQNLMLDKKYTNLQWMKRSRVNDKRYTHAIVDREKKKTIGSHKMSISDDGSAGLIIVVHSPRFHGKGVFEEVRAAIIDKFCHHPKIVRFGARVRARNFQSIFNYQKLGFRFVGYQRKCLVNSLTKEHEDIVLFEMLSEDWISARGKND
ncbi:MAG: GNAT family protein [Pseudomonadota bacterium]